MTSLSSCFIWGTPRQLNLIVHSQHRIHSMISLSSPFTHHYRFYRATNVLCRKKNTDDTKKILSVDELLGSISKAHDLSKAESRRILGTLVDTIIDSLTVKKTGVRLPGFGTFKTFESKARIGRNPSTGEALNIPSRERIRFKAHKKVIERINDKQQ